MTHQLYKDVVQIAQSIFHRYVGLSHQGHLYGDLTRVLPSFNKAFKDIHVWAKILTPAAGGHFSKELSRRLITTYVKSIQFELFSLFGSRSDTVCRNQN
jgi:hypothetical protein